MKTFKQFQEKLTHISVPLRKIKKDIKSQPGDKPYIQEPGKPPKIILKHSNNSDRVTWAQQLLQKIMNLKIPS